MRGNCVDSAQDRDCACEIDPPGFITQGVSPFVRGKWKNAGRNINTK